MRYLTAGESHGKALTVILEGIPAGLSVTQEDLDLQLQRRQKGVGRGARMKIEKDHAEILSGIRAGRTMGDPISLRISNRDWDNWQEIMDPAPMEAPPGRPLTKPRPGHADLAGCMKFDTHDARDILERSSAREPAARVAAGAVARRFLSEMGVEVASCVLSIGSARCPTRPDFEGCIGLSEELPIPDPKVAEEAEQQIKEAGRQGDSLGGANLVTARGVVPGLGSHIQWDRRLDARLGGALLSIPSAKAVEIGDGVKVSGFPGSDSHDPIYYNAEKGFFRRSNHAGGLEGGITNGEEIRAVVYHKPLPTLMKPLPSVDMVTKEPMMASKERSDICAVVPAAVIAEAVLSLVLAEAYLDKFGGDSMGDILRSLEGYRARLERF